jgi:transposase
MEVADGKKIHHKFKLNKNKTVLRGETTLTILKQIIDPSNEKVFDWAFATNQNEIDPDYIVPTYKGQWRIETGFRVQDEVHIKSKSKDTKIRFFYFIYEQVLQLLWAVLYKEYSSFKAFVIGMYERSNERVAREERESARANR